MGYMRNTRYPNAPEGAFMEPEANGGGYRYRLLGSSGLRVSEFALGTMTFGERRSWGIDERAARLIMDKLAEAGGTFLDTANIYSDGEAERILGDFLRSDRDRFVAHQYTLQTRPGDLNSGGNHRKNLVRSVEASLRSLGHRIRRPAVGAHS